RSEPTTPTRATPAPRSPRGRSASRSCPLPFLPVPRLPRGPTRSLPWVCSVRWPVARSLPLEEQRGRSPAATPPLDSTGSRGLTACRKDLCSTGAHLDALGLGLLHLAHHDLQHPVLERGLDLLGLDLGGQGDRAAEGAVAALDPGELLLGGGMGELPLALDWQAGRPPGAL